MFSMWGKTDGFAAGLAVGGVLAVVSIVLVPRLVSRVQRRRAQAISSSSPKLVLVGVGPGDPELLTLAATKALAQADLVVADFLTPIELIRRFIRTNGECKVIIANNKTKGNAHEAQEQIQQWTLDGLRAGLSVVRVKGGDPFLYGRGGEEVAYFTQLGFSVRVVPGISSSMAGPLSAGIPVTMRGHADQFMVCTLHGKRDALYGVPAPYRANRTLVFLMSVSRIDLLVSELQRHGYPGDLPIAIVERAMLPGSRVLRATVNTLLEALSDAYELQSPSIIMVGGTAGGCGLLGGADVPPRWHEGGVEYSGVV